MKINLTFTKRLAVTALAVAGLCTTAVAQSSDPAMTNKERATTDTNIKKDMPAVMKGPHDNKSVSSKDAVFVKEAAMGGMAEVDMGKMAAKQGVSPEVKKIGAMMVTDHGRMNKELMAVAKKKGIQLSKAQPMEIKGSTFDKDYLAMMVSNHNKDIATFQAEAKNGEDPELKAMAAKSLPTLKSHLAMVKDAQKNVK